MKFVETPLPGAFIVEPEPFADARGLFARVFCRREFEAHGLDHHVAQCNISFNPLRATLRGMHYQASPYEEAKLVRCTAGAVFDVIVDLRTNSPHYLRWFALELSAENRRTLYVPKGFAHGYLTLCDASEVFYLVSEFYSREHERGIRWDDPKIGIKWPIEDPILSERDQNFSLIAA